MSSTTLRPENLEEIRRTAKALREAARADFAEAEGLRMNANLTEQRGQVAGSQADCLEAVLRRFAPEMLTDSPPLDLIPDYEGQTVHLDVKT